MKACCIIFQSHLVIEDFVEVIEFGTPCMCVIIDNQKKRRTQNDIGWQPAIRRPWLPAIMSIGGQKKLTKNLDNLMIWFHNHSSSMARHEGDRDEGMVNNLIEGLAKFNVTALLSSDTGWLFELSNHTIIIILRPGVVDLVSFHTSIKIWAGRGGGEVAQSVERATLGEEIVCSIPLRAPAPYWLDRCQYKVTGCGRSYVFFNRRIGSPRDT